MNDTCAIQDWLAARLPAEEPASSTLATGSHGKPALSNGDTAPAMNVLDEKRKAVLREILQRPSWPLADFRVVAAKAGLMPWACLTTLNEWALDTFADLLLEGDQIVNVNQNLKKKIHV
jgi:hypothetical protein